MEGDENLFTIRQQRDLSPPKRSVSMLRHKTPPLQARSASTKYDKKIPEKKISDNLLFHRVNKDIKDTHSSLPLNAWKSSIMSNSGIMRVPQRSRQLHQQSLTFERIVDTKDSFYDKRSIASRAGNFIMSSSIGSTLLGSPHNQNQTYDDLTFNKGFSPPPPAVNQNLHEPESRDPSVLEKSPIQTPRSDFSIDGNQLGILEEMPEPQATYDKEGRITSGTRKGSKNKIGSLGSEEQFLDRMVRSTRRTIKMVREERSRRNTENKKNMKVQNIGVDELELESKLLQLGKTQLPTMQNWHMNIDDEGLAEHFQDGRSFDKYSSIESLDGKEDVKIAEEIPKHPNVLDDSFVQIEQMNRFEKLRIYKDKYCCLKYRKALMKVRLMIVECCQNIINSSTFENIILFIILANSITLIFEDPSKTKQDAWLEALDLCFLALYTLEMMLKICGLGFAFNKGAYIRDPWNILDFVIVISGYMTIFFQNASFKINVLRSFRVLRPLRTARRLEGLRILISAILAALPLLLSTIWILLFFFLLFAIAGLQLFQGALRKRCVSKDTDVVHADDQVCGGAYTCPSGYQCREDIHNPPGGVNNFDNIFNSLITIFQCVTLQGWGTIMDNIWKSSNFTSTIFFVPLVFIGAFFLLNLTLAVIKSKFTDAHTKKKKMQEQSNNRKGGVKNKKKEKSTLKLQAILSALMRMKFIIRRWVKDIREKKLKQRLLKERRGTLSFDQGSTDAGSRLHGRNMQQSLSLFDPSRLVPPNHQTDASESEVQDVSFSTQGGRAEHGVKQQTMKRKQIEKRKSTTIDPHHLQPSPSRLTAISEQFHHLGGLLGDHAHQKVQLVQGNKKLIMSGIAAASARRNGNKSNLRAISSIESSPRSLNNSSQNQETRKADAFAQDSGGSDLIQSSISSAIFTKDKNNVTKITSPRPLLDEPESPIHSQELQDSPQLPSLSPMSPEYRIVMSEEKAQKSEDMKLQYSPGARSVKSSDNVVNRKGKLKIKPTKRSKTMPVAGRQPIEIEDTISIGSSPISKDYLIFNSSKSRLNVFRKFKYSYNANTRHLSNMRQKFSKSLEMESHSRDYSMNETVQSLDQLKQLDNDFAKRLKDAHFVISKDDYFSSSYADVIKGQEAVALAKTKRKMRNKFKDKSQKGSMAEEMLNDEQEEEENKNIMDANDGRLSSFRPKKDSVDFLGKENEKKTIIRWRKDRSWKPVADQSFDVSAVEQSYTSGKSKGGLDSTRAQANSVTPRLFSSKQRRPSLFNSMAGQERKKEIMAPLSKKKQLKETSIFKRKEIYTIDQEEAEMQDFLMDQEEMMYENLAPYYLRISNSIVASGGALIDFEHKKSLEEPQGDIQREPLSRQSSHVGTIINNSLQEGQYHELRIRPYKVENEATQKIMFLKNRVAEMEAGKEECIYRNEFEKSIRTKLKRGLSNTSSFSEPHSSAMASPKNQSVGGIGAFSLCNSERVASTKKDEDRRKRYMKKMKALSFNSSMSFTFSAGHKQSLSARDPDTSDKCLGEFKSHLQLPRSRGTSSVPQFSQFKIPRIKSFTGQSSPVSIPNMKEFRHSEQKKDTLSPFSIVKPEEQHSRRTSSSIGKSGREKLLRNQSSGVKPLFDSKKKSQIPSIFASEPPPIFEEEKTETYFSTEMGGQRGYLNKHSHLKKPNILMNFDTRSQSAQRRRMVTGNSSEASMPVPQRQELTQKQMEIFIQSFHQEEPILKNFDSQAQKNLLHQQVREERYVPLKKRGYQWSGQDIFPDMIRSGAESFTYHLNRIKVRRKGCPGVIEKFKDFFKAIVTASLFDHFMIICVTINTATLAMDHYGISPDFQKTLTDLNLVFTIIFCVEMGLKLIGLSVIGYFLDPMNYLDGAVVILSIIEITVFNTGNNAISAFRTVRIFRTFRVLRVARLLRSLKSMHQIISVIGRSLGAFAYLAILLFLFMFIYALLGLQLFGNIQNSIFFSDFLSAIVSAFQIMTLENWQELLYATAPEVGSYSTLYFVSWIFIGNFILLNLFLAILLDSFLEEENEEEERKQEEEALKAKTEKASKKEKLKLKPQSQDKSKELSIAGLTPSSIFPSPYSSTSVIQDKSKSMIASSRPRPTKSMNLSVPARTATSLAFKKKKGKKFFKGPLMKKPSILGRDLDQDEMATLKTTDIKDKKDYENEVKCEYSLFFIPKNTCFRKKLFYMQKHKTFEKIIIALIMLSTVKLIYDTYNLDEPVGTTKRRISDNLDLFFTIAFTLESLIKSVALGFALDSGSYLTENWNQLDFFIVVTSLFDLALVAVDIPAIRVLRILRTLRPLRFISHNSQMKIIVTALVQSVSGIFNVVIVVVIVWLMFAILGVSVFAGRFGECRQPSGVQLYNTSKVNCQLQGNSFIHYDSNFNNVIRAMLTLFIVATLEGWPNIKDIANRAQDVDISLCQDHCSPYNSLYFMSFILIGSFFFLNLFVGVIFINFQETQKNDQANTQEKDEHWMTMQKLIIKAKPELESRVHSTNCLRNGLHKLVTHVAFETFIIVCIILNMIQMAISYYGAPYSYNYTLEIINYIFTAIFTLEAIFKLIPYGLLYFKSSWNVFDFIVVIGSLMDIILNSLNESSLKFLRVGPQLARVLRVLRVTRLFRLVNRLKGLQMLIQTVIFSVGALIHVFMLLLILFFIYSILGVYLFSDITGGTVISNLNNFSNFGFSMLTLLRVSTGEDWHVVMYDTMHGHQCKNGISGSCAVSYSPLYFLSFIVLCTFVVLNLFILVILQQFQTYYLSENNLLSKFKNQLEAFNSVWTKYSRPFHGDMINSESANQVLKELPSPLGTQNIVGRNEIFFMMKLNLVSDKKGMIHFHEMLYKIMKQAYGQKSENIKMLQCEINTVKFIRKKINETKYTTSRKKFLKNLGNEEGNNQSINPLLIALYYNSSIKVWRKLAEKSKKRQKEAQQLL